MGDPFFDLGNFSVNHGLTADEDEELLADYDGGPVRRDRLARLTLMRTVSDFREAMWGVLQQAISVLDVDFVAYAGEHFDGSGRLDDAGVREGAARGRRRPTPSDSRLTGIPARQRRHRSSFRSRRNHRRLSPDRCRFILRVRSSRRRLPVRAPGYRSRRNGGSGYAGAMERGAGAGGAAATEPRRSLVGNAGLLAIAFFGTLVVLLGLALGFRGLAASGGVAGASPSGGAPAPPQPSRVDRQPRRSTAHYADPVSFGFRRPGPRRCWGHRELRAGRRRGTARLLDTIPGTVFTAGDNAYDNGSARTSRSATRRAGAVIATGPAGPRQPRLGNGQRPGLPRLLQAQRPQQRWRHVVLVRLGAWHVVVLDSSCSNVGGCTRDSDQGRWLGRTSRRPATPSARSRSGTTRGSARATSMATTWRSTRSGRRSTRPGRTSS